MNKEIKAKRVGKRGQGTGQYQGGFTYGGRTSNLYEWACVKCGKVFSYRYAAINCFDSHKKIGAKKNEQ